jgi:hypothetical protein
MPIKQAGDAWIGGDEAPGTGGACTPSGAPITATKDRCYVVQQDDINSFWRIPTKFGLPARKGSEWRWKELVRANLDWPGGFVSVHGACLPQGLEVGDRLRVPASWPEPEPGVQMAECPRRGAPDTPGPPDTPTTPSPAGIPPLWLAGGLAAAGVVTVGFLVWRLR